LSDAGLSSCQRRASGIVLASSAAAPATTGHATEVPESARQPPLMPEPLTREP
jgi:hypothetical protein